MFRLRYALLASLAAGLWAGQAREARAQDTTAGPVSGYTSGSQLDRRPLVPVTAYSASTYVPGYQGSLYSPIFMTTINSPGIYGAYDFGYTSLTLYNREPTFYPAYPKRAVIPAITTTVAPLQEVAPGTVTREQTLSGRVPVAPPGARTLATAAALSGTQPPAAPASAILTVRVPENARLTFQGKAVPHKGPTQRYETPALVPGRNYRYDVVADWTQNGREVRQDRHVFVRAGERVTVDFTQPEPERMLRTGPLPAPAPVPAAPERVPYPAPKRTNGRP